MLSSQNIFTLHQICVPVLLWCCCNFVIFCTMCVYSSSYRGSTSPGLPGFKSFFESQQLVLDVVDSRVILKKKVWRCCISTVLCLKKI